jgi:hypothetical protein
MDVAMSNRKDQSHLGLMKLMLRMPALRGRMRMLTMRNTEFRSLCGAFDDAVTTLERLRRNRDNPDLGIIAEYESICVEIESDIIRMCARDA